MKKKLIVFAICLPVIFIACKKDTADPPSGGGGNGTIDCGTVKFSSTILPLIASKCATSGCHDATSSNGPGPLTGYAQIFASRTQILASVTANRMPRGGPALSTQEKGAINCWIDAGAPNN